MVAPMERYSSAAMCCNASIPLYLGKGKQGIQGHVEMGKPEDNERGGKEEERGREGGREGE